MPWRRHGGHRCMDVRRCIASYSCGCTYRATAHLELSSELIEYGGHGFTSYILQIPLQGSDVLWRCFPVSGQLCQGSIRPSCCLVQHAWLCAGTPSGQTLGCMQGGRAHQGMQEMDAPRAARSSGCGPWQKRRGAHGRPGPAAPTSTPALPSHKAAPCMSAYAHGGRCE